VVLVTVEPDFPPVSDVVAPTVGSDKIPDDLPPIVDVVVVEDFELDFPP